MEQDESFKKELVRLVSLAFVTGCDHILNYAKPKDDPEHDGRKATDALDDFLKSKGLPVRAEVGL